MDKLYVVLIRTDIKDEQDNLVKTAVPVIAFAKEEVAKTFIRQNGDYYNNGLMYDEIPFDDCKPVK